MAAARAAVTSWLAAQGAPVIAPTADVDPGPHEHDGLQVTLWTHVTIRPEPPAQQDFDVALADLHSTLRAYPGDLPVLIPAGQDIVRSLQRTDRPVAWDLASATIDQPAIDAYPDPPSPAQRETYRDVRRLQILTAALAGPDWFPEDAVLADELLRYITAQE